MCPDRKNSRGVRSAEGVGHVRQTYYIFKTHLEHEITLPTTIPYFKILNLDSVLIWSKRSGTSFMFEGVWYVQTLRQVKTVISVCFRIQTNLDHLLILPPNEAMDEGLFGRGETKNIKFSIVLWHTFHNVSINSLTANILQSSLPGYTQFVSMDICALNLFELDIYDFLWHYRIQILFTHEIFL